MVQELIDLKQSVLEGRYEDALLLIDELENMSKQAILRNIESCLVRLIIHLIKNQLEQRLTNSWVASISDSIVQIKKLNLKDNKKSFYLKKEDWQLLIEEAIEQSIRPASVEVLQGSLKPLQISTRLDRVQLTQITQNLLNLTDEYSVKDLPNKIDLELIKLPGGEAWFNE
jgi:hypothetical protein